MNLEELIMNYDVKLVALKNKRRFTSKAQGYAYMNKAGMIMIPRAWRKFQEQIEGFGVINQYIPDLGYYLCCLDVDTKDFPLTRLLSVENLFESYNEPEPDGYGGTETDFCVMSKDVNKAVVLFAKEEGVAIPTGKNGKVTGRRLTNAIIRALDIEDDNNLVFFTTDTCYR